MPTPGCFSCSSGFFCATAEKQQRGQKLGEKNMIIAEKAEGTSLQLIHLGTYTFLPEAGQLLDGYRQTSILPGVLWEGQQIHLDQPAVRDPRDLKLKV